MLSPTEGDSSKTGELRLLGIFAAVHCVVLISGTAALGVAVGSGWLAKSHDDDGPVYRSLKDAGRELEAIVRRS